MNHAGYSDPTAEQAIGNVMKESKATRYLPKHLHKALRALRDVFSLIGYEITDIKIKDRESGREYLWTLWEK